MLFYLFVIGTICTNQILAQIVHDVVIPPGKVYEMINPGYPNEALGGKEMTIEWNLKVENNGKIKIVCEDIRMAPPTETTSDCPATYVSTTDGQDEKKVCGGFVNNYIVLSKGPTIKFKGYGSPEGDVVFKCNAINMGDPEPEEIVYLEPMGHAKRIFLHGNLEKLYPNVDRLWVFESPPGTRMSVQCLLSLTPKKPICGRNAFIFNNGETDEEVCDYNEYTWFSKANKAKIRLQLDHYGQGLINCVVQAITGQKPNEFENVIFEEVDSSEHGLTPGRKQTSCKCGWTNKLGARIVSGKETKPNRYPWMVHMYINHITYDGDKWGTTCGASILTQRHVLTAAHCVQFNKTIALPENIRMEIGKHDQSKPTGKEVIIHAERIFVTEKFIKTDAGFDDISVIFTKETIDFSSPIAGPICLEQFAPPVINKQIKIMGWGLTEDKSNSKYLREGKSTVVDWTVCDEGDWIVCTTSKPSGFCSGDSGGPLVWLNPDTNRFSQVSLVSRANSCTALYMKSTNVTYYYDWIQEKIRETDPSMRTCHQV
uniref:Venom S1 protease 26 n=1 Tax=Ectomocoris sp. TaxID=3104572 RepID=A0AB38ZE93_9HEMI